METKIQSHHLNRPAMVYIRQSTLAQVHEHRESTERQYALVQRAQALGWDASQVRVLDEDLGQSGASATQRTGFQHLVAEVSLGRVGAIVALEVSRLARSSADWHRLVDLCALSATLIVDDDGVYDPNDFNDRLVLGLKGTMSDAERHLLRLRLLGGARHKASKGLLAFPAPTGYVFDERGALVMDPDEAVQASFRLFFERFRLDGSAYGAMRYFHQHGLLFPSRRQHKDAPAKVEWKVLTHMRAMDTLRSPFYAGTYAYGRRPFRRVLVDGTVHTRRDYKVPRDKWAVLIHDAHPGYLTWEQYLDNQRQLDANRASWQALHCHSVPRNGSALLQGLVICGRCGRRMMVNYHRAQHPIYVCKSYHTDRRTCWSVPTQHVDARIVETVLAAVVPEEIDLSLSVVNEVDRQAQTVDRQWKLRLERTRYETERAERQYQAVEPENRLVARTLEAQWNEKLRELEQAEREYEETRQTRKLTLTTEDRRAIAALAHDLPRIWHAPTTTNEDRKRILRLLIEDVSLTPIETPKRGTRIQVQWKTGATQELTAPRPAATENWKTPEAVVAALRELVDQHRSDTQIAVILNERGLRSGHGRPFNPKLVTTLRRLFRIHSNRTWSRGQPLPDQDERGRYSTHGLAAHYEVSEEIIRNWIHYKVIAPDREPPYGTRWLELTPEVDARIQEAIRRGYGPRGTKRRAQHPTPSPRARRTASASTTARAQKEKNE